MEEFNSKKPLPLLDLSRHMPKPVQLGYPSSTPAEEQAKQERDEAEAKTKELKRQMLLKQSPGDALKNIIDPHCFGTEKYYTSYYSLCCLVAYLFKTQISHDTFMNTMEATQRDLEKTNKRIDKIIAAELAKPNAHPTNAPQSIKDRSFALLRSILVNKVSIIIISLFIGLAFFIVIVGGAYMIVHKYLH